ncbi:unnamed protein product [Rangifer tarandus platyrhynchus]|uniref:Uncharacterized protein n=2 Tax=Rangifer tarandus platyrhynchus TaxID=3082113 RepID=A0ACB0E782_RANTA|nr:unnamed protein product [Rangifer tarandus platyrhynchus]CAI9696168.1 unnamed protein product [Rangifer tarandus platyrhynchus]
MPWFRAGRPLGRKRVGHEKLSDLTKTNGYEDLKPMLPLNPQANDAPLSVDARGVPVMRPKILRFLPLLQAPRLSFTGGDPLHISAERSINPPPRTNAFCSTPTRKRGARPFPTFSPTQEPKADIRSPADLPDPPLSPATHTPALQQVLQTFIL